MSTPILQSGRVLNKSRPTARRQTMSLLAAALRRVASLQNQQGRATFRVATRSDSTTAAGSPFCKASAPSLQTSATRLSARSTSSIFLHPAIAVRTPGTHSALHSGRSGAVPWQTGSILSASFSDQTSPFAASDGNESRRYFAAKAEPIPTDKIRNVAIIAHVDHGKTTLVDALLKAGGQAVSNTRLLDQGDLEKEKGITILAKATRILYEGYHLNIVDTPGHAAFGGEVERVLSMVDGVVLVIDHLLGPMIQTKFVLSKALQNPKVIPIVLVNKIDKPHDRVKGDIDNEVFDAFLKIDAADNQMDYPVLFGSAKEGWVANTWEEAQSPETAAAQGVRPLLQKIVDHVEPPQADGPDSPFKMLVSIVELVPDHGHCVTGKVSSGVVMKDSTVYVKSDKHALPLKCRVKDVLLTEGITKKVHSIGSPGDIITLSLAGATLPFVHDSILSDPKLEPLPFTEIDPPSIAVTVYPNTSPFVGKDGKYSALDTIGNRLRREALVNLAIDVRDTPTKDGLTVKVRGDLQLIVLLETMRREGYEFCVSPPRVEYKIDSDGKRLEPWDKLTIILPTNSIKAMQDKMVARDAELIDSRFGPEYSEFVYHVSARSFFGMYTILSSLSGGEAEVTTEHLEFRPVAKSQSQRGKRLVLALGEGQATEENMTHLQSRVSFFVAPSDILYEGMIIGETSEREDLVLNLAKEKKFDGMYTTKLKAHKSGLKPINRVTLEVALNYVEEDELVEVTPARIAMRKLILNTQERRVMARKGNKQFA